MSSVRRWWRRWVEPAAEVADPVERRQGRLLTAIVLLIIVLGAVVAIARLLVVPEFRSTFPYIVCVFGALVGAYALAYRGRYVPAAAVTCAVIVAACYAAIYASPANVLAYVFLVVPVILASLLLPGRAATFANGSVIVGAVLLVLLRDRGGIDAAHAGALLITAGLAGLVQLATRQRDLVERDRQARLAESEQNLRALADNASDGILITFQTRHVFANLAAARMLGYTVEELCNTTIGDLVHPDERPVVMDRQRRRMAGEVPPSQYETVLVARDGARLAVELTASITTWMGRPASLVFIRDIRARLAAQAQMRKLSSAVEQTADAVLITDCKGVIEYVNPAFETITGYTAGEVIGQNPKLKKSGKQSAAFYKQMWRTILDGRVFSDVFINQRKDGTLYYEEQTVTPLKGRDGGITHFVATGRDISERIAIQERLQYIAHHDVLTDLPNRALFMDRLKQALARARWHNRLVAVMFLDLDRFKQINDSLGHEAGDRLLSEFARRINASLRDGDTVARFGGDEFVVLLDDLDTVERIDALAQKTLAIFARPFDLAGQELVITASLGVGVFPNDGDDAGMLLQAADTAMYRAKETGRNGYQFYSKEMGARVVRRLSLESGLRRALDHGEFILCYQPVVDVTTGRAVGAEALLRWQHPERGLIEPAEFISVLEDTALIEPVGAWVLQRTCAEAQAWTGGAANCSVGVNISGRQLTAPTFLTVVQDALHDSGLAPHRLVLEVTESFLMHNIDVAVENLKALAGQGVRIAIDDFGIGYSSLSYLKHLPIDVLKIDQSFVRDLVTDSDDVSIVDATIAMAQGLKLEVIGEGVENDEQLQALRDLGCHVMQGYHLSRPVPGDAIATVLRSALLH